MRPLALALVAAALAGCGGSDEPASEPPPRASAGAPAPGGGLTVEGAIASDARGPLAVRGNLVHVDGKPRLCSAVLESHPPQCGEPSLALAGDLTQLEGAANGDVVSVLGDVDGGALVLAATSR